MNGRFLRSKVAVALLPIALGSATVLLMSSPADAKLRAWNSKATPLTVSDGSTKKGAGYGTWKIGTTVNGTRSQAYGYLKDLDNNGHNVYFELFTQTNAGHCIAPQYTQCDAQYYHWRAQFSDFDKETWNNDYWSGEFYASTDVNPSGNYSRARMRVSESNGGPDTHSGSKYTKGNPY